MKVMIRLFVIILILASLTSCSFIPVIGDDSEETTQINPLPEAANKRDKQVTLYFRYADEFMLGGETRSIEVPVNESIEMTVLKELFIGPSQDNQELQSLIPNSAEIISVSDTGEYLFVTLSSEFISQSKIAHTDPSDEEAYAAATEEMKLSIYSMVNTLIELGGFSRVQILVDKNDSGRGERISLNEIGQESPEAEGASLEPLGWDGSLILTPENTVSLMLELLGRRDYESLYALIAYNDSQDIDRVSKEEFVNIMSGFESSMEDYNVMSGKVSADGSSVIVPISFAVKTKSGDTSIKENIIMRLRLERDLWKVEYSSFSKVFLQ